jgi:hypothetical protein
MAAVGVQRVALHTLHLISTKHLVGLFFFEQISFTNTVIPSLNEHRSPAIAGWAIFLARRGLNYKPIMEEASR